MNLRFGTLTVTFICIALASSLLSAGSASESHGVCAHHMDMHSGGHNTWPGGPGNCCPEGSTGCTFLTSVDDECTDPCDGGPWHTDYFAFVSLIKIE